MVTRAAQYPSSFSLSMPSATKLNRWSVTYITRKPGRRSLCPELQVFSSLPE